MRRGRLLLRGPAAKAARARADDSALRMSEAHLHNIAKEAERRALKAEKAANRESATEAEKGEAAAARAAVTAAWARADDSALRKSEAHLHNTCTTCRGHGSGGARRFDQLSSTQIDAA